ncbi:Isoquinoline 1-oxidoreductase beta subunit [Sulfuricella denitrificans skB26]|uniref:Isoquinoline 1-oxidoreductase beta subunit n=1 Tax=Sulfuricella denitrificans (strain DSM 22764 / NBRC 105220 / skB26) TaxID=1163617 RepID=S6AJW1_SULDS|nr:xanthine dehydrogenase family protein molybdopterin-binding subunit [Sulfuricella denitrificans]BAN34859.1 Isoquinoline 1-oxidoreductase beta subunit [Sulfuricella denitrificans skB26]
MDKIIDPTRRKFLKTSATLGAGLTIAFYLPVGAARMMAGQGAGKPFAPNAFIRIAPDDTVTVIVKHLEMGQGVNTGLPTLVAEELDVPWEKIRVESAPADAKLYNNLLWGPMQGTGGSTAMANSFDQMRRAGATARAMLIAAAADNWKVDASTLATQNGMVLHRASGRKASYGKLADKAATMPQPAEVTLKSAQDFKYIGKQFKRTDSKAKSDGSALFASDLRLPGQLTALIARPPLFGAKVKRIQADKAKAVPGVRAVVEVPRGVAVIATDFWSAKKGRDALQVEWDETGAERVSSAAQREHYLELLKQPGMVARNEGDAAKALGESTKKLEATFEFPYLAHAPMEPINCVVKLKENGCEIWAGSQMQTGDQATAAKILGIQPEQVQIHTMLAGGSFGRRANPTSDYIAEAVSVAKAVSHLNAPIRLMWTREDDIHGGYYRPMFVHAVSGGLDEQGNLVTWSQRLVGQSIVAGTAFEGGMVKDGIDMTSVEGVSNLAYKIPNLHVELHSPKLGVPVLWWRSVGHTHTAFSTEVFIDELAVAAGKDPYEFRRSLLAHQPRHIGVLELAAAKAGWGKPLAPKSGVRRGRGIAVHESFHSFTAEVAEVSVRPDGSFSVDRVVCAVDCGVAVNPDQIGAQMEGGIGFALSAALHSAITFKDGRVEQSNFNDYPLLRISEMPQVEVHIVPSQAAPTGVGEPGVPPLAPAVANALFAATGKRLRKLPFETFELRSA